MKKIITFLSVLFVLSAVQAAPTPLFPYYFGVSNNVITTAAIPLTSYQLQLQPVTITLTTNYVNNSAWGTNVSLLNTNQLYIPIRLSLDGVNWVTNSTLYMPSTNAGTYTFVFTPTGIPVYVDAVAIVTNNTSNPVYLNGTYGY